jgi:hypothetical protein
MAVNYQAYAAQMLTQIALLNGSISTVGGSLQEATPVVLKTVYTAVQNALVPFQNAIAAFDADIDTTSVGGVIVGLAPPQMSVALLNQALDLEQQARLVVAEAYVARAGVNVNNSPG